MSEPMDALPVALRAVASTLNDADIAEWCMTLAPSLRSAGIVTVKRIAMFVGQCAVETAGFTKLSEDLDYSAKRISQVWPTRYPTADEASHLAHNPQALANAVYANRMGNGDPGSGDGWLFRARGLIGTTGRDNYVRLAAVTRMDLYALLPWMETPPGAVRSACVFWSDHSLNSLADGWEVAAVTRIITGGSTALAERVGACARVLAALSARVTNDAATAAETEAGAGAPEPSADDLNQQQIEKLGLGAKPAAPPPEPTADDLNDAELRRVKGTT